MTEKTPAPKMETPKPAPARPNNPNGNPGYHPSTQKFEHGDFKHSSEDR